MAIRFDADDWRRIRAVYAQWWRGELSRPLLSLVIPDAYPGRRAAAPLLSQANCADLSYSPEQLIDALDARLERCAFLGDSFPSVNLSHFGPGVLAAFCGARLDNSSGRVWFFADKARRIEQIHVRYDADNIWAQRIKALYRAGIERWGDGVALGMPDLGGVLDVAAVLRGSENLLTDLYDAPEEVLRLCGEIEIAWYAAYDDFSRTLRGMGHTDWSGLYSDAPSYVLQSDFSYMISPEMFRRFALPTLARDCERLAHTIYHLDGVGQLPHLDHILALPKLDAVQWVYGDGQPSAPHWMDVYRRIERAGKRMWVVGSSEDFLAVAHTIKCGLYYGAEIPRARREIAEGLLRFAGL